MKGLRKKIYILLIAISLLILGSLIFFGIHKFLADTLPAPIVKWTGIGSDATCGGAGSGNWWSCSLNWSTGLVPTAADHVVFDSTSIKNSTIDLAFPGTVHSVTIYHDYSGVVAQERDLAITHDFNQHGATFNSNPNYKFNVSGSFFIADNQINNGTIYAIRSDSLGRIYIGGSFQNISGLPIRNAAVFDGKKWSALGPGLDGDVATIAIDSTNKVYFGGKFKKAGTLDVNGIAMWNGATWNALAGGVTEGYGGTPLGAEVKVIEIDDQNKVYVGGTFENAGPFQHVNHLARWTGSAWERINFGVGSTVFIGENNNSFLSGYVNHIIVKNNPDTTASDKDIYIGGNFKKICSDDTCTAGDSAGNYLVKYDGKAGGIVPLGGLKGTVGAMAFDTTDKLNIYSSNNITASDGKVCSFGYLDGTAWFCHSGWAIVPNNTIYKIKNINDVVYVGGSNSHPGSITSLGLGSLGYGLNGNVYDMTDVNGSLYIAGSFSAANTTWTPGSGNGNQTGSIVKYNPAETNVAKRLASPFSKAIFNRYSGDGSAATPYQIIDVYGLQAALNFPDKIFSLANDIDASVTNNWNIDTKFIPLSTEKKPYYGQFNGNNHTINNLKIGNFSLNAGLFGVLGKGGKINDLNMVNASLLSTIFRNNAGIIVGKNLGYIKNIKVQGSVNVSSSLATPGYNLGGVVGFSDNADYGTGDIVIESLSDIESNISMNCSYINNIGGILGNQMRTSVKNRDTVTESTLLISFNNLVTSGSITANNTQGSIGGVIGRQDYEYGTVNNSHSSVSIGVSINDPTHLTSSSLDGVGGLVGYSFGGIRSSDTTSNININSSIDNFDINSIGNLVGYSTVVLATIPNAQDSHATGSITITQLTGLVSQVGGMIGTAVAGPLTGSYATGPITINSGGEVKFIGALLGYASQNSISSDYATGNITIDNHSATNQYATGAFGGLIGLSSENNISSSHATGDLSINADPSCNTTGGVGGLVGIYSGLSNNQVYQSYARGKVESNCIMAGGLIGSAAGHIDQSFSTGLVKGTNRVGGLIGQASGINGYISNTFSLGAVTGDSKTGGLIGYAKDTIISKSYSGGKVTTTGESGGLVGVVDTRDTTLLNNSDYSTWDFTNIWTNDTNSPTPVLIFAKDLWPNAGSISAPSINTTRSFTYFPQITLSGNKSDQIVKVLVNNIEAILSSNSWSKEVNLSYGQNLITIIGKDQANNSASIETNIVRRKSADANNDSAINIKDFSLLMANWNKTDNANQSDFNEDGKINILDFSILMSNWGK